MLQLDKQQANLPAPDAAGSQVRPSAASLQEAFAQTVLASTMDAVIAVDEAGLEQSFNRAAERAFGWKARDIVGQPVARLVPAPDRRRRTDTLPYVTEDQRPVQSVGLRKDGSRFPMEVVVTPFVADGVRHATWFVRDVTERTHLEAQLRQSQKMDAMGQLAGGIAHDFNNLLTVINGWCETLASDSPADRRSAIEQIGGAAARAATLTAQLLAFGRKAEVSPTVLDLNEAIADVARMLERVIGENIALELIPDPQRQFVRIDRGQLDQVLVNLAVNARDAMPRGGRLTIATAPYAVNATDAQRFTVEPGAYVRLRVSDTGVGMSPELSARIFEPFFTTKGDKGTGLGLATVYGIVRQASGGIIVQSRPGEGAVFSIVLPLAAEEPEAVEPPPAVAAREQGTETVLLVEDEPQVRAIAVNMLRTRGYRVLVAGSGAEAMAIAGAHGGIALVVTDVVMPDESGPHLVARLRQTHPALPALYVSGYASDAAGDLTFGGDAFLQKPYTGRNLALRVREILDTRAALPRARAEVKPS
jgi:PAS domain S-box-containing protein